MGFQRFSVRQVSSADRTGGVVLQPSVDTLDVVVMETGQHPQLLPVGVITETDLTLGVPGAAGGLECFGGKPLDFPPTELPGHDGTLTLLELQKSLVVVSLNIV